jgi:hypothetical protein
MTDRDAARDSTVGRQFRALRQEDAGGAPPFAATLDAAYARRAPTRRRHRIALAAAAVIAAALVLLVARTRPPRPAIDLAAVRLPTPTDFLLQLPGADLLSSVPELGAPSLPDARFLTTPIDRRTP